ncbi:MAG: hypothetical protein RLY78_2684, partial [Pseudomonadota bacterium]
STGDHLAATLSRGDLQVAGVDLMLLASAGLSAWAALRLRRVASLHGAAEATRSAPRGGTGKEQQHA